MNHDLKLSGIFGTFLAEGARAAALRLEQVEPALARGDFVTLDFDGVRNINSSFANSLIAPLIELHGQDVMKRLRFRHCNALVRVIIESALTLGLDRASEHGRRASA